MLERVGNYFSERRRGLFTAAGVSGTVYLGGKYMSQRIEEMREEAVQVQRAKENLRRRFEQNQEDVMFTIMAHLPTLGKGVVEGMDVEAVTKELQARSKKARKGGVASGSGGNDPGIGGGRTGMGSGIGTGIGTGGASYILGGVREPSPNPPTSESSLASSVELLNPNNFGSSTVVTHNANNNNKNVASDNENENTRGRAVSMSTTDPLSAITESSGFGGGVEGIGGDVTGGHAPSTSSQSWVDEFSSGSGYLAQSQNSLFGPVLAIPPAPSSSGGGREPTLVSPVSNVTGTGSGVGISVGVGTGTGMSDSFLSDSMVSSARSSVIYSDDEREISSLNTKSKAELWQEIKILTFTRTLTIIYSATLLSLLTTLQLNILGRSKYVQSVKQLMREERVRERERRHMQISVPSLILGGLMGFGGFGGGLGGLGGGDEELFSGLGLGSRFGLGSGLGSVFGFGGNTDEDEFEDGVEGGDDEDREFVTPEAERKFLTLSWWLLYMGWKDIGERVRRSVEEVFEGVSLKTRLGPKDLHRLICDVRRRVEHEITYEGTERRINFLSSIIPPSPETLSLCFSEGGVPGYRSSDIIAQHTLPSSTSSSLNTLSTPHPLTQTLTQTQAQAQASPSRTQYSHSHIPTHVQEQQRQQQQNNPYFPSPSPSHIPPTVPQSKLPEPLQHTRPSPPLHSHSYPQSQQPHPLQPPPIPSSSSSSHPRAPRSRPDPESDKVFGRLLGELRCTAASPVFGALLEGALERAVEVMFEDVRRRVFGSGADGAEGGGGGNREGEGGEGGEGEGRRTGRSEEEEGEKPRLANMLPELAKWAHSALDTVPNELVDSVVGLKETTALAAIIYSSYEYPPLS